VKDVTDLSSTHKAKERKTLRQKPRKFEDKLKSTKIKKWLTQRESICDKTRTMKNKKALLNNDHESLKRQGKLNKWHAK